MPTIIEKFDEEIGNRFDARLTELLEARDLMNFANGPGKEYQKVGPEARHKLKGILQHYAKEPHPFTACVKDNTKRFGPERAQRVCAVLKDIIWGTTKWRGKGNPKGMGPHPYVGASEPVVMTEDDALLFEALGEMDLWELMGLAALDDDCDIELKDYSMPERMKAAKQGHALPDGSFPIKNESDLKNAVSAIGRAKDPKKAKKHIINRAKALSATQHIPDSWNLSEIESVQLAYPIGYPEQQPLGEKDHAFLDKLHKHHSDRLKVATAYATDPNAHPDVVGFATDAASESTRQISRINRMKKTGRPY